MRCTVKKTFKAAILSGNDVIVRVKSNQPRILKKAREITQSSNSAVPYNQTFEKRHGRLEFREVTAFDVGPTIFGQSWDGLIGSVIEVFRRTTWRDKNGSWRQREETALYVSTCSLDSAQAAVVIRGHWGIENRNHYVRDVTMREDSSRIRTKPVIWATIRSFVLNIMRKNNVVNISQKLFENALDLRQTLKLTGIL